MSDLFAAISKNDPATIARYAREGFSVDVQDADGRTPLMHAVLDGRCGLVKLLIELGADLNAQDGNGFSALHFAAQNFQVEPARSLCRAGAEVDLRDRHGNTPLWRAVFDSKGRGEMIRLLLESGADRKSKNKSGKTPLDLANTIGNYDLKQFLL